MVFSFDDPEFMGTAFGAAGAGFLRLCFAVSPERLAPAMDRLAAALG